MDDNTVRGLTNQILFEIDAAPDISGPEPAAICAAAIVEGELFGEPPGDYLEAADRVVVAGRLPTPAEQLSGKYTDEQLVAFLRTLSTELRSRGVGNTPAKASD